MVSDSPSIPDSFEGYEGLALIFSNIGFIPLIFASAYKRKWGMLAYYSMVMSISTFYHFCTADYICIIENVHALAQWDFIFAMGGLAIVLRYILALDHPRYRGAYLLLEELMFWIFFTIIIFRVLIDREAVATFIWIISISVFYTLIKFLLIDRGKIYVDDYYWGSLIVGFFFILPGLGLFFISTLETYWSTHAFWHVLVSIGLFFVILARKDRTIPVYLLKRK